MSNALRETGNRLSGDEIVLRDQLSKTQDADIYHSTSEFKRTEAVLQGTLMASTKLLQPSLLNFLQ
jgi:flagellar hook-associated protein 3 FlgL